MLQTPIDGDGQAVEIISAKGRGAIAQQSDYTTANHDLQTGVDWRPCCSRGRAAKSGALAFGFP